MDRDTTTPVALARHVRIVNDPRVIGTVIDIDPTDGWVMWVSTDGACHFSKPDYIEAVTS